MTGHEADPLDSIDDQLLDEVAALWERIDPVPDDLTREIRFHLGVRALQAEIAELQAATGRADLAGALHRTVDPEPTDTLTFTCARLSAMVTLSATPSGGTRMDGWVTASRCEIEVRGAPGAEHLGVTLQRTRSDADGRFTVEEIPAGPFHLVLHPPEGPVVTPYVEP